MTKMPKIIFIVLAVILLLWLPIIPVNVVPEVTLRVVNTDKQPVASMVVFQVWQHWTFESQDHRDKVISDENGFVTFSEKKIWVSAFKFLLGMFGEHVLGGIAIHASSGPSNGFGVEGYKTENKWCYPEWKCPNGEISKEIILKEELK